MKAIRRIPPLLSILLLISVASAAQQKPPSKPVKHTVAVEMVDGRTFDGVLLKASEFLITIEHDQKVEEFWIDQISNIKFIHTPTTAADKSTNSETRSPSTNNRDKAPGKPASTANPHAAERPAASNAKSHSSNAVQRQKKSRAAGGKR